MTLRAYSELLVGVSSGVATLTLNRPERRNALGPVLVNELLWALDDASADDAVRSIVLTGAGKVFSAGGDFGQMTGGANTSALPPRGDFKDLLVSLFRTNKPVIARVNGHAMGGGLGLVAACTFAVASTDAKLGTPEVDVGLFPFMIFAVLERIMTRRRLMEMVLFGQKLTAAEAAAAGLVNVAVAPADLDAAVAEYAGKIAEKSPVALRLGLEALRDTDGLGLTEKVPALSERLMACLGTEDAREGLTAFLEKRAPKWQGR
ncbi:MAG TPA: enoyl-CoA hydratase-related protein [Polyangiaceae bacterium]|jgi:enoyl-CoA hydratase/carnithine racemase|nr:enoyl-CoA hydratase-related protein [Polyangiaceae bacterium]